ASRVRRVGVPAHPAARGLADARPRGVHLAGDQGPGPGAVPAQGQLGAGARERGLHNPRAAGAARHGSASGRGTQATDVPAPTPARRGAVSVSALRNRERRFLIVAGGIAAIILGYAYGVEPLVARYRQVQEL